MAHGYESGRLNLPFVGISTFAKKPYIEDWDAIDADVCILGAPFDFGTQWRSGARFGPRGVREASTLFLPQEKKTRTAIGSGDDHHVISTRANFFPYCVSDILSGYAQGLSKGCCLSWTFVHCE